MLLPQLRHQIVGEARKPCLRVPPRGRDIAVHRAEVALADDQRFADHPDCDMRTSGVINGDVAVRVVIARDIAEDLRAFTRLGVDVQMQVVVHRVQDAALDRLQAVAHVRQARD